MDEEAAAPSDVTPSSSAAQKPAATPAPKESLYGRVKTAKQKSSGSLAFFKALFVIFASTIGCTICVALVLAIPIAMIVIGSIHIHDCPRERYIPIYLVVAGVFGIIRNISSMVQRCKNQYQGNEEENAKTNPVDSTISLFLFAWFIAGSVWIYSIHRDFSTTDPTAADYCDHTLYWFAFWINTLGYIFMFLSCCCACCTGICALLCAGGGK